MTITPILTSTHEVADHVDDSAAFAALRRLVAPVWVFDIDTSRIVFANAPACALWQSPDEAELTKRDLGADMSSTVASRLKQYQADFLASDATFTELWTLYPNGEPKSFMVVYRGFILPDGRTAMQCEVLGESVDQPQNVRSAEALLHTDVVIMLFSKDGPPLYQNPAARNGFVGPLNGFADLFLELDDYFALMETIEHEGEHRIVSKLRTAQGLRWYDVSVKRCLDAATGQPALLVTAIDVTELKEARDTARYLADRDQLTNAHNRTYLQSYLERLEAHGAIGNCAIIFFDVDRFKQINDRFGHEAGDTVLRQIAIRTRATIRVDDLVVRLGGDEFVVLIEGYHDTNELSERIERLRSAISKPIVHEETRIDVGVSVGVSIFAPETVDFNEVLREADIALYASKQAGRDRITFFTPAMGEAAAARTQLEVELKHAVEQEQFTLYYQPRFDVVQGKVVGVEGLARWNHPSRGLVLPDAFIPVCEETGLIEHLGRQVLEMGCRQAIEWQRQGLDLVTSLNVSPRQFGDPGLLDTLARIAKMDGFPKGKIELEITENALIGDHSRIAETLKTITAIGYQIAIDDFGTGYSNLSYISRFPLNCLKIDRTFIGQLPDSGPIVQLILTLGEQVGARVVCEGVETEAQMAWLRDHKCAEVQGYYITHPMTAEQFEMYLRDS